MGLFGGLVHRAHGAHMAYRAYGAYRAHRAYMAHGAYMAYMAHGAYWPYPLPEVTVTCNPGMLPFCLCSQVGSRTPPD